jgi:sterol desaturase/sphingolipid hydroxylase (fatty acid hydroxylase superfamily)
MDRTVPGWMDALLVGGTFGVLLWLERRHPLRKHAVEPKLRRGARNLAVAALAAAAVQVAEKPVTAPLTRLVGRRRWGLLQRLPLPAWLEVVLAAVLLDYTLYLWHVLTHRVPLLWRFHQVHHADLDMDASTAVRFHFGEMTLSVAWRAMQVRVIGVRPLALSVWNTLLLPCVMFHHSNAGLPLRLERRLSKVLVTPRMHAIHHSIVPEETNANWSSGLTAWDRLHRTLRLDVAQDDLTLGVPAYRRPGDVTLPKVLAMPFTGQPPGERLPDGTRPRRGRAAAPRLRG